MFSLVARAARTRVAVQPSLILPASRSFTISTPFFSDNNGDGEEDTPVAPRAAVPLSVSLTEHKPSALCVKVPLPKQGNTMFYFTPGSTVGSFLKDITREDNAVDDVRMFGEDGTAIASPTHFDALSGLTVSLAVDNRMYLLAMPTIEHATSEEEISASLARMSSMISGFEEYFANKERIHAEIAQLEQELAPMEDIRRECEQNSVTASRRMAWGTLVFLGLQFGFLARLTWWEYSWDLMEPVSYFIGLGTDLVLFSYFVITQTAVSPTTMTTRRQLEKFYKLAASRGLDVSEYNALKDRLASCQKKLQQ